MRINNDMRINTIAGVLAGMCHQVYSWNRFRAAYSLTYTDLTKSLCVVECRMPIVDNCAFHTYEAYTRAIANLNSHCEAVRAMLFEANFVKEVDPDFHFIASGNLVGAYIQISKLNNKAIDLKIKEWNS